MRLKITVNSVQGDEPYGGEQILDCEVGEYRLDEIFRLPFFRIIIDEVIDGFACFRLMEGGVAHYFAMSAADGEEHWERQTSIGEDCFTFKVLED